MRPYGGYEGVDRVGVNFKRPDRIGRKFGARKVLILVAAGLAPPEFEWVTASVAPRAGPSTGSGEPSPTATAGSGVVDV